VAHSFCVFKFIPVFWILSLLKFVSPFSIFGLVWKGSYSTPSSKIDIIINFWCCVGDVMRQFISVPEGTTWAEATLRISGFDTPRKYYVNAVQLVSKQRPVVWSSFVTFQSPSSKSFAFPLIGGVTMELTIAQFWSSGSGSHIPANADIEVCTKPNVLLAKPICKSLLS
jgi:hypothetical protein